MRSGGSPPSTSGRGAGAITSPTCPVGGRLLGTHSGPVRSKCGCVSASRKSAISATSRPVVPSKQLNGRERVPTTGGLVAEPISTGQRSHRGPSEVRPRRRTGLGPWRRTGQSASHRRREPSSWMPRSAYQCSVQAETIPRGTSSPAPATLPSIDDGVFDGGVCGLRGSGPPPPRASLPAAGHSGRSPEPGGRSQGLSALRGRPRYRPSPAPTCCPRP